MSKAVIRPFPGLLAVLCISLISACGSPEEAAVTEPATDQTEAPASPAEPATEAVTDTEAVNVEALGGVAETEGLTEDADEESDIELSKPATAPAAAAEWKYKEGEDFRRLTTSQGTSSPPDKIEVAEVFWYGCPHCYNFDPILTDWEKDLPPDVAFVRIPVIWNPTNQAHARLMYTAEALGVLDQAHLAVFKAIHQDGDMLTSEASILNLFKSFGVEEDAFNEAYKSFGVSSAVKRAENLTRRYGVRSVPVLVINGKYVTDSPNIKTFGDMLSVTNELVQRERARN